MTISRLGLACAPLLLTTLAACSDCTVKFGVRMQRGQVEAAIAKKLEEDTGVKPERVSCAGIDESNELGEGPFACTATIDVVQIVYRVTLHRGTIHWDSDDTLIATREVEKIIADMAAKAAWGAPGAVATCPPTPRVRISRTDDELECRFRSGAIEGWAVVHVKDGAGGLRLRLGQDGSDLGGTEDESWIRRAMITETLTTRLHKETGLEVTKVDCPGTGQLIEVAKGTFACHVTLGGEDVVYDVQISIARHHVDWKRHATSP